MGREGQGGGEKAEYSVGYFILFYMRLDDFFHLCQSGGYRCDVGLVVCLSEGLFEGGVGGDDVWLVYDWHSMEQDIALKEFAPNKEARALPHFYGCSGEGCEE